MNDLLARFTALPNLHPAIVHFPVALLATALAFDLASVIWRRQRWLDRAAAAVYILGVLGAGAAYLSGEVAEDGLLDVPAQAQLLIAQHADWAVWTLVSFGVLAVARAVVAWADRRGDRASWLPLRVAFCVGGIAGQWLILQTADRGGALVFRHGIAVARRGSPPPTGPALPATPALPTRTASAALLKEADGAMRWTATEGEAALGAILIPADPASGAAVRAAPGRDPGLAIDVRGRAVLVLPGRFDNVQVEARMDASGFRGTVGVAHHVRDSSTLGAFQISTDGRARLVHVEGGESERLDERGLRTPAGPVTLAVSAAGAHFKGMINGKVVVHGHRKASPPGRVGLLVEGTGVLRVLSMRVVPLDPR